MIEKDLIVKRLKKADDRLLLSKVLDKAVKAERSLMFTHTDFLDPYQQKVLESTLEQTCSVGYAFTGGYDGAERQILCFRPNFILTDFDERDFLKVLKIQISGKTKLSHRDYLGSLTSLGIKREKIGDILVRDKYCDIIVMDEVSEYIRCNLAKVRNVSVKTEIASIDNLEVPAQKIKDIKATVASLRLDCILSAGFGLSRSKAANMIKAGRVSLNWQVFDSIKKQVKEGDTISIRGKGRVVLDKVLGETKKGRISILIKRFV